jgi:hypothetical protein
MSFLKLVAKAGLALVLAVLVLEVSFRIAGAIADTDRGTGSLTGAHEVVLCIGDSHTWGMGKGYPARLGELLGKRSARYRVINLGVAGSNTAQIRKRLLWNLDRFQPRLLVLWAGVNNKYNRADTEVWQEAGVEPASLLRELLDSSRTIRFFRLWQNERRLNEFLDETDAYVTPADGWGETKVRQNRTKTRTKMRRSILGEEDVFDHRQGDHLSSEEMQRVTELDFGWIIGRAKARGIPVIVVAYPLPGGWFKDANVGIRAAAAAHGVPVVEAAASVDRLRKRYAARRRRAATRFLFDRSVHPRQPLYDAIGEDILRVADENGYLPSVDAAPRRAASQQAADAAP